MAMSISGTIMPRKFEISEQVRGARGSLVKIGQSRTSSTSSTGKQKRSRPLRKDAVLRFRGAVFERAECFEQISGVSVGASGVR